MLAVRRHDRVGVRESLVDADGHGFLTDVEVHETPDTGGAVQLHAAFLEPADAQHRLEQGKAVRGLTVRPGGGSRCVGGAGSAHADCSVLAREEASGEESAFSRVEVSPSGRPSSRARSRRRMTLPMAGVRQVLVEGDLARRHGRAQSASGEGQQFLPGCGGRVEARPQRDERLDDVPGDRIGVGR